MAEVTKASDSPFIDQHFYKTGIPQMDVAVGGGIPAGRITEICGSKSSAKTTVALTIIKTAQERGESCVFVDAENALDLNYAQQMGVDLDALTIVYADYGESYLDEIEKIVSKGKDQIIILDSVDALLPRAMVEADNEQQTIGAKARMLAKWLPKIITSLRKNKVALVMINQQRIDVMTGFLKTPGGMSLEFYKSVQIKLKATDKIKKGEDVVGIRVKGDVAKNKVGEPFKTFSSNLFFKTGFSWEMDLLEQAEGLGVITKSGNTFWYKDTKMGTRNKAKEFLENNPDIKEQIKNEI